MKNLLNILFIINNLNKNKYAEFKFSRYIR